MNNRIKNMAAEVTGFIFKTRRIYLIVSYLVILELINLLFIGSTLNLIITIPEIAYVLFLLFVKNDIKNALICHVLFCLTAFDTTTLDSEILLYSYSEVKLFGPITISYIILGMIWIRTISIPIKKRLSKPYYIDLEKLY